VEVGKYATDVEECTTDNLGWFGSDAWSSWGGFLPWGASMITFGAAFGGMILGPIVSNFGGRRFGIAMGALIVFVSCMFSSYWSLKSVLIFMVARFMTGFGVGVCCFSLPLYNAEVATPGVRGATGSMFQFFVVVGVLFANLLTSKNGSGDTLVPGLPWEVGMCLPGFLGVFLMCIVWVLPESPRWLMEHKGVEAARAALQKFRTGDVEEELQSIKESIDAEKNSGAATWGEMFAPGHFRKRVIAATGLQFAQQFTGVNAIYFYQGQIFAAVGHPWDGIAGVLFWLIGQMIGVCIGILLIDSTFGGRRPQILTATIATGPALLLAALGIQFGWPGPLVMAFFCIYGFGFQLGWGFIPWVFPAEIFSMREKEKAMGATIFMQYFSNGLVTLFAPKIMHGPTGVSVVCYFFAACNIPILLFLLTYIKETKGVPLEKVPALFGAKAELLDAATA